MLYDIHNHVSEEMKAEEAAAYFNLLRKRNNIDGICINALPTTCSAPIHTLQNLRTLHVKDILGDYAHAFMGLVHDETAEDYLTQLKKGLAQGFEGLKILETKPDVQKMTGIRIYDEKFDPLFSYMEEMEIPCIMHVGDPPEHWDIEKIDKWSLEHGRYYGGEGFLSRDELYGDVEKMLVKHPNLKVIFAHFYFFSNEIDRATELFERFPKVCFDLTPGKEMYENFGNDLKGVREFFKKYADRIYYGTDVHDTDIPEYHDQLYALVSNSLSEKDPFDWYDYHCTPLNLAKSIRNKIKAENFIKLLGKHSKPVNYDAVQEEINRLTEVSHLLCDKDKKELERVKEYFFGRDDTFRLMTFNIQHGKVWETQEIDLDTFANFIRDISPDICGLNEVRGQGTTNPQYTHQAPVIGGKALYNSYFGESVKISGTDPYGNALLSKTAFKSVECVKIPDIEDGKWHETRSVIKAITEIKGRDVCFLVSHFGLCDEEKRNAVEKVCGLIDSVDMPLVLMGDFNMRPDDEKLLPIRERMSDADELAVNGGEFTYSTYDPAMRIDYVFYRGLECLSCEVVKQPLSDHFPILCKFKFA